MKHNQFGEHSPMLFRTYRSMKMWVKFVQDFLTRFNALASENKELKAKIADMEAALNALKQGADNFQESGND